MLAFRVNFYFTIEKHLRAFLDENEFKTIRNYLISDAKNKYETFKNIDNNIKGIKKKFTI